MNRLVLISAALHAGLLALLLSKPLRNVTYVPGVAVEMAMVAAPRVEVAPAPPAPEPVAPAHVVAARAAPPAVRARSVPAPVVPQPEPAEPAPTRETQHATTEPPPPAARALTAESLLTQARADVARMGDVVVVAPTHSPADVDRERMERVRERSQGYVAESLAEVNPIEPSHVHEYYNALARRMRETWRPGFYHTPSMVDALVALPRGMAHAAQNFRDRASTFGLTGRPDDPGRPLIPTDFEDRNGFSTRTTSTIVEVEQDESGQVTSVRVVRSARVRAFDDAALTAVRAAFPLQPPMHLPRGRRSRWAFDVVASRDIIAPFAGFMFDESRGFFEMHYPGALHVRTRIRPMGSRPRDVPWPVPRPLLE